MNIFKKKNKIIEPQEPEPAIDSEPNAGCEPCPGESLYDIISERFSHAEEVGLCEDRYSYAKGYCVKEDNK